MGYSEIDTANAVRFYGELAVTLPEWNGFSYYKVPALNMEFLRNCDGSYRIELWSGLSGSILAKVIRRDECDNESLIWTAVYSGEADKAQAVSEAELEITWHDLDLAWFGEDEGH